MSKSFLLIVEGEKTEKDIFQEILKKYDFNVLRKEKINIDISALKNLEVEKTELSDNEDNVILIQGSRNRIKDLMIQYKENTDAFERLFKEFNTLFAGVFFIYDVDHNNNESLHEMYEKYHDETSGLLLVSSPCIEVICDPFRKKDLSVCHLSDYKKSLNKIYQKDYKKSAKQFIIDNFDDLIIHFIDKNYKESKLSNVLDHPKFVIDKVTAENLRGLTNDAVLYRYFTTVVYVSIAYMKGLVKEFDNIETVRNHFKKYADIK